MKKAFRTARRTASALLAVMMVITSMPQAGAYAYAANQTDKETSASSQSNPDTAESTPSHDGTDPVYALLSETGDTGEYLIDDTLGYTMRDVTMTPGSYSARFSAKCNQQLTANLMVLYTTDKDAADSFFPGVTKVAFSDAKAAGFIEGYRRNPDAQMRQDENGDSYYELTGDFAGSTHLMPETTYYYRVIYQNYSESMYYFLSAPRQFTTGAPVETSSIKITSLEVEEAGYNKVKVVWTVENPDNEYIYTHYLRNTETNQGMSVGKYTDKNGETIPGKYCASPLTKGATLTFRPELEVYTGTDGKTAKISCEESLTVQPVDDIRNAEITATVQTNYDSLHAQIRITPWYAIDNGAWIKVNLHYRAAGETEWQTQSTSPSIQSGMINLSLLRLSSGTYEYYIELTPNYATECIWNSGSETEPLSFTIENIDTDSLFPDEAFRNLIKKQIGISQEEKITSDMLDKVTYLAWDRDDAENDIIQSLEGIQYLKNLTRIYLCNHVITNAEQISSLTKLTSITLTENELAELPDLSNMTNLQIAVFWHNKIISGITADKMPAEFLEKNPSWLFDTAKYQRIQIRTPSQTEIKAKYVELPYDRVVEDTYAEEPHTQPPYSAGRLSDESLNNALNAINFARYVAGVPFNVGLDENYMELAQTGALVNAVNGVMTHYPARPEGFPDDLHDIGYRGCMTSNIAFGFRNTADSIVGGYLNDSDSTNIDRVGHRRWVLNPPMSATGLGNVNAPGKLSSAFYAMYAFDASSGTNVSDFVAWPAQNMPLEFMMLNSYEDPYYAWSVSLGTDYRTAEASQVTVTMRETGTGKTWTFNQATSSLDGNYFNITDESQSRGSMGSCIIFRPKIGTVSYEEGSQFEVTISGLKDKAGNDKPLSYTVNFFALEETSISLDKSTLTLAPGATEFLIETIKSYCSGLSATWSSSDPHVARVDDWGYVTGVSEGTAVITASYQGKEATCTVTVTSSATAHDYSLSRTELNFDLAEGTKTEPLTVYDGLNIARDVSWRSEDESVASVSNRDGNGVVTPKGPGSTRILAKVADGTELVCEVTVQNNVLTSISLNLRECALEKGSTRQLRAYLSPNNTTLSKEILWTSDHPEVASVDASGMVTALSKGTAVITVSTVAPGTTSASGTTSVGVLTAQCTVTVYETATPAEDNIPSGLQALTNVQTKLSDVSLEGYEGWEWENGDISLAQFAGLQEKSFLAVYRKEGYRDYRTALDVSLATLTGISITADKTTLGAGGTAAADIQWKLSGSESILSGHADTLQWSSSNPAVLTVTVSNPAAQAGANASPTDAKAVPQTAAAKQTNSDASPTDAKAVPKTAASTGVTLRAGSTSGKATVTAQITMGDKTYTARQTFTIVDGAIAEFGNITVTDGFTETTRNGNICYEGKLENGTGTLSVTVTNATKLTVKSGNTKVLSTGKMQEENAIGNGRTFRIPLTMKAAGMAKLTLTANDAAKSKTEILCYVKDARPNLGESTVTINKLQTAGTTLFIYPNDGYTVTVEGLGGADASLFEMSAGTETDGYCLKAKKDTAKGSYKLTVKATTAEKPSAVAANNSAVTDTANTAAEQSDANGHVDTTATSSYELPLTVKVTEQAPKYKVKQSAKANLFYSNLGAPRLTITTEETLTGLTLTGCDFTLTEAPDAAPAGTYAYSLVPGIAGTLTTSCNTKGTLTLTFEGYEPIAVPYTVGIESKKPKFTLDNKTITLYPNAGVTHARLRIMSGKQTFSPETVTATLRNAEGCELTPTGDTLTINGAGLSSDGSLARAVTKKAEIRLTCHDWTEEIILPLTIKADPGKPALKLQKSTLQLNAGAATLAYDMAETEVLWKNGAYFDSNNVISVSAVDAKSQEVIHDGIVFEQMGNKVLARLNNKNVAAGSYKFKVHAPGISAASASLTVKVVNADLDKAVKISAKGSIDVLNRAGSSVTVTPSLKSLNGQIKDAELAGDFAHLFQAELNEKNQIVIRARETDDKGRRIALITKYNYNVNLVLTIQNAQGETMQYTTPAINLKLKQGKPKVTATPKNAVFFSGAYNSVKLDMTASLKGAANPEITNIELINQGNLFDYREGVLTLRDTGPAAKGKSYSLQFRITFRDQADNEKATIVKVNAKVK